MKCNTEPLVRCCHGNPLQTFEYGRAGGDSSRTLGRSKSSGDCPRPGTAGVYDLSGNGVVPEPASFLLILLGLPLVFGFRPVTRQFTRKNYIFFSIFLASLMATSVAIGNEINQKALTKKDIGELIARDALKAGKILVRQPSDIRKIESTGVVIETQEPDYVVIRGDRERFEKLRAMGFSLEPPVEADYRIRLFRAWVRNKEELFRLRAIVADPWPDHIPADIKFPRYIRGQAYDSDFKRAKEAGLNIQRCNNDNCE